MIDAVKKTQGRLGNARVVEKKQRTTTTTTSLGHLRVVDMIQTKMIRKIDVETIPDVAMIIIVGTAIPKDGPPMIAEEIHDRNKDPSMTEGEIHVPRDDMIDTRKLRDDQMPRQVVCPLRPVAEMVPTAVSVVHRHRAEVVCCSVRRRVARGIPSHQPRPSVMIKTTSYSRKMLPATMNLPMMILLIDSSIYKKMKGITCKMHRMEEI